MDKRRIYWHEAQFEAMKLEFHNYMDFLSFTNEYQLSKEALKVDILIIKKSPGVVIRKNIGRLFRTHNIVEYKSETDYLSIRNYHKVLAYALLYSSFENVPLSELTITFSLTKRPVKLLNYLQNERGLALDKPETGITYVVGEMVPVQILETKLLPEDKNLFIKHLRKGIDGKTITKVLTEFGNIRGYDPKNVYFDRLTQANKNAFKEAHKMSKGFRELYLSIANETDILEERDAVRDADRARTAAKRLFQRGFSINEVSDILEIPVEELAATPISDILEIPVEELTTTP